MSRIRSVLIDRYTEHYARVNAELNPESHLERNSKDMELLYGSLISSLPTRSRVLDLGCGTGLLLHWLSQQPTIIPVGVDSSISQVARAKQTLPNVDISLGDGLEYLQKHPQTFAGIFCLDVLVALPRLRGPIRVKRSSSVKGVEMGKRGRLYSPEFKEEA